MGKEDPRHLLTKVAEILADLKIPYFITGGIAVLVWGRPRFTADIDVVVELERKKIAELEKSLAKLSDAGYLDKASIEEAAARSGEFNFIDGNSGIKVDFWVIDKKDHFEISRFKRRVAKKIFGKTVYFISPEDLILVKLKWFKESNSSRQIEDVESILKISREKLNRQYLKKWAEKLGLLTILNELLKK